MRKDAQEVLEKLSLSLDPDAVVSSLSVAEQQLVEIAKAISIDSSLLIMDEPTAALGLNETKHLLDLIRRLTARGKAVLYISHRLDEVFEIADRVTVLKDGRRVKTAPISEFKLGDLVRMMVGYVGQPHPKDRTHGQARLGWSPTTVKDVSSRSTLAGLRSRRLGSGGPRSPIRSAGSISSPRAMLLDGKDVRFVHPGCGTTATG
jgi:ABC-type sugar transport system ATPase subunit